MAPKKRKTITPVPQESTEENPVKRMSKVDRERRICQKKLNALEKSESTTDDRFNSAEKERLLEAYNKHGFQVFQDLKLLHQFYPNRRENDLKGLIQRLRTGLQSTVESKDDAIEEWQRLCQNLMGNFARHKRVNLDDVLSDALLLVADEREAQERNNVKISHTNDAKLPNYAELLRSFAQLLSGKFPDNMTPANARISMKLFDHINRLADSVDLKTLSALTDGSWLKSATEERRKRLEMASEGLKELDRLAKTGPSLRDLEKNQSIEALCLELPKIKRITEVLNPLHINESLMSSLINL